MGTKDMTTGEPKESRAPSPSRAFQFYGVNTTFEDPPLTYASATETDHQQSRKRKKIHDDDPRQWPPTPYPPHMMSTSSGSKQSEDATGTTLPSNAVVFTVKWDHHVPIVVSIGNTDRVHT